jgi:hypothetical protein
MANDFDNFLKVLAWNIRYNKPTSLKQDDSVPPKIPKIPILNLHNFPAAEVIIIKLFEPKNSMDMGGIGTNLLKKIAPVTCTPL